MQLLKHFQREFQTMIHILLLLGQTRFKIARPEGPQ